MIKKYEVETYVEKLYCDKCGEEMTKLPCVSLANPLVYAYECPKCKHAIESRMSYPRIFYIEKEKDNE